MSSTSVINRTVSAGLLCLGCLAAPWARAELKLPPLFADNAVLQQGQPVPVWGTADPGATVTVTFHGQSQSATAAADGSWQVKLAALPASATPAELAVAADFKAQISSLKLQNVLVGEVWVCSGQSNMDMMLAGVTHAKEEMAAANLPAVRMFTVAKQLSAAPLQEARGVWVTASPETVGGFSAVGYFFARDLHRKLGVPVGMLNASWGGTPAQGWTPLEVQRALPAMKARIARLETDLAKIDRAAAAKARAEASVAYQRELAVWLQKMDALDPGAAQKWAAPAYAAEGWRDGSFPMLFDGDLQMYNGFIWCRKQVRIPQNWVGKDLTVGLCAVDECHVASVNGTQVGMTWYDAPDFWLAPHQYRVPAALVTGTDVTVALRIFNLFGGLGTHGPAKDLFLLPAAPAPEDKPVSLAGAWRYQPSLTVAAKEVPQPHLPSTIENDASQPSLLYNGMIAPLQPFGIRGAIWYQGESNAGEPELYLELFPAMIKAWRQAWGQGDFPFYYVQLANFMQPQARPIEPGSWAELRETQRLTLALKNTGMAVITDIGDAQDIHPRNKQDVGKRLALAALAQTYGQKLAFSGPMYRELKIEGNRAVVIFDHAEGMASKGGTLRGFAIAGADKVFHWAAASIAGGTVVLSSEKVAAPVAVRYNWGNNPPGDLINAAGLPASSFRTDAWSRTEATATP